MFFVSEVLFVSPYTFRATCQLNFVRRASGGTGDGGGGGVTGVTEERFKVGPMYSFMFP